MQRFKLFILAVALAVCAVAVGVALAGNGRHSTKAHVTVAHVKAAPAAVRTKAHLAKAAAEQPDPGESSSAESTGDASVDGVDAGGDHQCPPACAQGEQP